VKRPIGTGPWKFVSRNVGTRIECEANPDKAAILAIDRQAVVKALLPPIASTIASLGALLAGGPRTGPGVTGYDPNAPT